MSKKQKKDGRGLKFTHGAYSLTVRQRFDDMRTNEGQALNGSLKALVEDLGGEENLTGPMRIIIDANIRPKLILLMIINDFLNRQQGDVVSEQGELMPCLGNNYIAYSNALRRDLEVLTEMAAKAGKTGCGIPTIEQLISAGGKE